MNIYNLQDFKCPFCFKWFHPKKSVPLALACGHSICPSCLSNAQKSSKTKMICPHHGIFHQSKLPQINEHIQAALQRLLKNHSNGNEYNFDERHSKLSKIIQKKQQDSTALVQLLQRIYTNEINRIICLRNRVLKEIRDPYNSLQQWTKMIKDSKNFSQIEEEGKSVKHKIQKYQELDLEDIANKIIQEPGVCFERHFSIENLLRKQKKVIKSSKGQKNHHQRKSTISSINPQNKENIHFNQIKTIESPLQSPNALKDCKLLTSFKLEQCHSQKKNQQKDISNEQYRNNSQNFLYTETNDNTTLMQLDQSKYSFKQRYLPVQEKRKDQIFRLSSQSQDLIASLKNQDILNYSEDLEEKKEEQDEMLLSGYKNFMKNVEIQQKKTIKDVQTRRRIVINSQKQQDKYIKKMQILRTEQAYSQTKTSNNTIQLINIDLKEVNLKKFLDKFDWKQIQVVKFVGTGLQNEHLNQVLNHMINSKVHSLILPNNQLQSISLDALIRFSELNRFLKFVSLQKNPIHQTQGNAKTKVSILKNKGIEVYL